MEIVPDQTSSDDPTATHTGKLKLIRLTRLPRLYRLMRIMRLFKLLRLLKSSKTFKRMFDLINMNVGVVKMINVTVSVFFIVHLIGCLWFL